MGKRRTKIFNYKNYLTIKFEYDLSLFYNLLMYMKIKNLIKILKSD